MTNVTINKKKYNLEKVLNTAIEMASDGYICPPDKILSESCENPADAAYRMTIARYIRKQTGWLPRWDKLDRENLLKSLEDLTKKRNKRAGVRALVNKYGVDGASNIVKKHSGRTIREAK